jgi:hypothetical protein
MTAKNKWLLISESRGDSNRCTPYRGKPDQHDTYASHASPRTPSVRFLWAVPIRGNLSQAVNIVEQGHCSREKGLTTQSTVHRLIDPWVYTQFLSQANQWSSGGKAIQSLLGSYHQHVIGTFNTCSRGPIHRFLTDTGEGYNLGGVSFPHTTPRPSQPVVSLFHLRAPPSLEFNQIPTTKPKWWV